MTVSLFLADFGAGLFLCNAIPHLAAGLRGEPFPTPFASPPGKGHSSPLINTLWGAANLLVGLLLGSRFAPGLNWDTLAFFVGFVAIGAHLSIHFEAVRRSKK